MLDRQLDVHEDTNEPERAILGIRMVQVNYGERISVVDPVWCNDHKAHKIGTILKLTISNY